MTKEPKASFNDPLWIPISNPTDLKHLGKLGEELSECGAAVARCIIQGVDGIEPVTGKPNREWLEDEIADVLANISLVTDRFGLDLDRITTRGDRSATIYGYGIKALSDDPRHQG